jgi:hypothetical protein
MKNLVYIFIILVLATACKKKTMVVIQAQNINNPNSGSDYAGMAYGILESWTPGFELKTNRVATGVLDANGQAAFDLKMKPNRKYDLGIQKPDNICYTEITLQERLDHEKNNTFNFKYGTCGYVNLPRTNSNCEGPDDKFRYKYYYTDNPDIYIYIGFLYQNEWDPEDFIAGCIDYSNINVYHSRPTGNYTIEWQVERPSGTTTGIDYFTITENDTTNYLIEY